MNDLLQDISEHLPVSDCYKISLVNRYSRRLINQKKFDYRSRAESLIKQIEADCYQTEKKNKIQIISGSYIYTIECVVEWEYYGQRELSFILSKQVIFGDDPFEKIIHEIGDPDKWHNIYVFNDRMRDSNRYQNDQSEVYVGRDKALEFVERALKWNEEKVSCFIFHQE